MLTNFTRRQFLATTATAAAAVTMGSRPVIAAMPSRMEVVIGFGPGGGTDRGARVIAAPWAEKLGITRPVQFTHAPGAGTLISTRQMLAGRKDGSVVQFIPMPYTAWTMELKQGDYTLDQLAWVGGYFDDPNILLVPKNSKYNSIDEFIDDARKEEKTVAVSAPLSASHAAAVVLRAETGAKLKIVPFSGGGGDSRNAVAGGHVDSCMAPFWSATNVVELTKGIGVFAEKNPAPGLWPAPVANEALNAKLPYLFEPYAIQIAAETKEKNPDVFKAMVDALKETVENDAKVKAAAAKNQNFDLFLKHRTPESCQAFITEYLELLADYRGELKKDLDSH